MKKMTQQMQKKVPIIAIQLVRQGKGPSFHSNIDSRRPRKVKKTTQAISSTIQKGSRLQCNETILYHNTTNYLETLMKVLKNRLTTSHLKQMNVIINNMVGN